MSFGVIGLAGRGELRAGKAIRLTASGHFVSTGGGDIGLFLNGVNITDAGLPTNGSFAYNLLVVDTGTTTGMAGRDLAV